MKQAGRHSIGGLIRAAISLSCVLASSGPAFSQEKAPAPSLSLELNALQQQGNACRIVFLAENRLGGDLDALSFETVLINTDGIVDRLTLFDFGSLPENRIRVRQFDLDSARCDAIGRVLINGAAACEGENILAADCVGRLMLKSRANVEISG